MWKGRQALAIAITLAGPLWIVSAEAAPNWTTPVVLPLLAPGLSVQSAYADGGVEFSARVEVAMPVDLDNVSTRLVVSRQAPGAAAVDELVIQSTTTSLPLGGVIAVAPNGAAVVAFPEGISNDFNPPAPLRWRAVYRNADGTWEEPATLFTDLIPTPNGMSTNALCAIAPDGTAVAGAQHIEPDDSPNDPGVDQSDLQLDLAIHPAGGSWQASQRLSEHNESVDYTPGVASDDAGNFTAAWSSRFSEGPTNNSNDDRHTLLVRRKLSGQSLWNAAEDVTGSDITKDVFFVADRGMGLGPGGRAVLSFQYASGKVWAATRSDSSHTFGTPVQLVTTGSSSVPNATGVAPDGSAYVLYNYQGSNSGLDTVGLVKQAPNAAWTPELPVAPLGLNGYDGAMAFDGNDAIAVWAINHTNSPIAHLVESSRWPAGAAAPEAFRDLDSLSDDVSLETVVSDRAGSVVATWSTSAERKRSAWDHGAPIFGPVTLPAPPIAGVAGNYSATAMDLWSAVAGQSWSFGDGTAPVPGTAVAHTYAVSGVYTITLTAADSLSNESATSIPVTVQECEVLGGLPALQCRCTVGLGIGPCVGTTLPKSLDTRFQKACAGVTDAAAGSGKKAKRAAGRAAAAFKKGGKILGSKAGKKIAATCRDPLAALFGTARDAATTLKGSL